MTFSCTNRVVFFAQFFVPFPATFITFFAIGSISPVNIQHGIMPCCREEAEGKIRLGRFYVPTTKYRITFPVHTYVRLLDAYCAII